MPKAPPTSSVMTRSFSGGTPMMAAPWPLQRAGALRAGVQRVASVVLVADAGRAARFHRGDDHALVDDRDARDMRRARR